jgi:hypothetical protein
MTVLDARLASQVFDAAAPRTVAFGNVFSSSATSFVWNTTHGNRIHVSGSGFTYGADGKPTGGTATRVRIDLGRDGDFDATFSRMSVPLAPLVDSPADFWFTLLRGNDSLFAPNTVAATLFGDFLSVRGTAALTGGRDRIVGSGPDLRLFGDAAEVGSSVIDAIAPGRLTGGRDTLIANNTAGTSVLIGDAASVGIRSSLTGNADVLTGSDTRGDTLIGDASSVFGGSASGGNDWMSGRGGDDVMIGDVGATGQVPGSTGGSGDVSAFGGHDRMNGGAGDDRMIGDIAHAAANQSSGAGAFHRAGHDQMRGGNDDDTIFGDTEMFVDGFFTFGNDKLYGEAGDDVVYGDYETVQDLFFEEPTDTTAGGNDYLDGGDGADQLFGRGGRDNLVGGAGNDQLQGDAGNDRVSGGAGDDIVIAALGDDRLFGDEGAPAGSDTFRFLANSGKDVIQDFQNDVDTIEISSSYGFADGGDVVATATISGSNVILHLDANNTITLYNYALPPGTLEDDIAII